MTADSDAGNSGDTREAIMEATYRALRTHGYADLSISKIADEFDKSKSVLYYHYEDRDELLVGFLDFIIERFSDEVDVDAWTDPDDQLRSFFDRIVPATLEDEQREFQAALFELRAQAPHSDAYRERFTQTDALVRETFAEYIAAGIEQGVFREVDPETTAQLLVSVINGAMLERVTTEDEGQIADLRRALDDYVNEHLAAEPAE